MAVGVGDGGWWQWLGFAIRWISMGFAMGFDGQWQWVGFLMVAVAMSGGLGVFVWEKRDKHRERERKRCRE